MYELMVMNACCDFIQLFEGLKAFCGEDGKVRIFRPDMNCKRLNQSAEYACLPVSYVYPFVCICVSMCLSMCIHVSVYVYPCVYLCVSMCLSMCIHVSVYVCACWCSAMYQSTGHMLAYYARYSRKIWWEGGRIVTDSPN